MVLGMFMSTISETTQKRTNVVHNILYANIFISFDVVDVGVANAAYPAVTLTEITKYKKNTGNTVSAFLNACGSDWQQPVNTWLADCTCY